MGMFEAARFVPLREKPVRLDRSEGDIHADGNPHIQTDPRNMLTVGMALAQRFAKLDRENAQHYMARQGDFSARFSAAIRKWEADAGAAAWSEDRRAAQELHLS
jgi:zinc/manganese transport system substrate-binding protein